MYMPPGMLYDLVVETLDGKFYYFSVGANSGDHIHVTEKDLRPLPGFQAVGNNATEAPPYFYKMFGLEKVESKKRW